MDKPKQFLETERQLIHLMLKSRGVIGEVLDDGLSPDLFDPHHEPLVECIFREYAVSGGKRRLSREGYRQMLLDQKMSGDMMQNVSIYDACFMGTYAKTDDLGYLKKLLIEGHMARSCHFFFEDFRKEAKKSGFLYASNNLSDKLQSALGITETRRTNFSSLGEMKDIFIKNLKHRAANPDAIIRCGIPEIDIPMNVGFKPQHLTLVVADVGGHKSNLMLNIGLELYDRGHNVLFVPLEMPGEDLLTRIIANRANVSFTKLAHPSMFNEEEWKRIEDCTSWYESKPHRFYILDAEDRPTVSQLQREIEKRAIIFKPEVVIIDYVANIKPDVRYGERNDLEIGEILKSLRFLGRKHNFHTISAAQMGRSAIKAMQSDANAVPDSTSIRGSHEYSADSDTIFGLLKIKDETNRIKITVIKSRHGPGGTIQELQVDPDHCRIMSTAALGNIASSIGTSENDLEWTLNQPAAQISEEIQSKSELSFIGLDLDEEDDISCLG